jgi:GNAT superfamily N-acetyltransferase
MKDLVFSGTIPGILAYADGLAVGWCSIAPREDFGSLEKSRTLKRLDDRSVWLIVCFFVQKAFHSKGLKGEIIQGAIEYAKQKGAKIIEAYTAIPERKRSPIEMYMGSLNTFLTAGFNEVAKAGLHVIVRKQI